MRLKRGFLDHEYWAFGIFLYFGYVAVMSSMRVLRYERIPHHPGTVLGVASCLFIAASFAFRSRFGPDRLLFGILTLVFALMAIRMAPLTRLEMHAVKVSEACAWIAATATSAVALARLFKLPK